MIYKYKFNVYRSVILLSGRRVNAFHFQPLDKRFLVSAQYNPLQDLQVNKFAYEVVLVP